MNLKEKLKSGTLTVGSWITLAHPGIAEIMAQAGFDWLTIDLEHSVITIREAEELIRVVSLAGRAPLVRLTSNNADLIKRVMDAGAHGIIVPMVNSKEDALKAVRSVHYPPKGTRGVGLARGQKYGNAFQPYRQWLEEDSVIIVQIEHIDAVNAVETILSIPEVDGYILGPYDLSASMGLAGDFEHPKVVAAIQKVREAAHDLKKPGGLHIIEPNPQELRRRVDEGFRFLAYSLDIRMLAATAARGTEILKELC